MTHGSSVLSLSSGLLGSTPFDGSTPLSMDTAYSSMHQDTPSSFWQTPLYQDTPHTSPLSQSIPSTPPQYEGLPNLRQLTDTNIHSASRSTMTPDSQPTHCNPHLVQLTPNIKQGALIKIIQNSRPSKSHMPSGRPSHPVGRTSRGGHRSHVWEPKYQNAYNHRPEHRYVHRPVFNRPKYRSGRPSSLVPLPATTQPYKSPAPCASSADKLTSHVGQNTLAFMNTDRKVPVDPSTVYVSKLTPVSQHVSADTHHTQANMTPPVELLGKTLENPLKTPIKFLTNTSPQHVPELQQGLTDMAQSPEQCTLGTERSPSTESSAPDSAPTSLDSRIQMLLATHGSDLLPNNDNWDSDTQSEDHLIGFPSIFQHSSKSNPPSPQSPDFLHTHSYPEDSRHSDSVQKQEQDTSESGVENMHPTPLPDSPEEGEISSPINEYPCKIPVISTQCSVIRSAPSHQTASVNLVFTCSLRIFKGPFSTFEHTLY